MLGEELKTRYEAERNKRIREDGPAQYVDFRLPQFSHFNEDPWIDYDALAAKPPALKEGDDIKVLVIGGGHAAICFAYRLFEIGIPGSDICIVDVAGGLGGTWYWNRYPGLMCDVEGYIYLPLLEETGYIPKHKYSYGKEIRQQSERVAEKAGFKTMFSTRVTNIEFDQRTKRWIAAMTQDLGPNQGEQNITVKSHFVYASNGPFFSPRIPGGPGFDLFASNNQVFHTARWQYGASGGSEDNQELVLFKDKTVAVVGTGATAIQVIPEVAKWAKHLYVVQRTPSYVGPRNQAKTDPVHWEKIATQKGWQQARQENFDHFVTNDPLPEDLVGDGWSKSRTFGGTVGSPGIVTPASVGKFFDSLSDVDTLRTEELRAYVDEVVQDKETAEKLKPWYYGWCKRPSFHDDYLAAFNRSNVTLLDTKGQGLQSYTKSGFVANGVEYQADVLILATGFSLSVSQSRGIEDATHMAIVGRNGRRFGDKWISDEAGTVFGIMTEGFPNLFFGGQASGAGTSPNLTSIYDISARLAAYLVRQAMAKTGNSPTLTIEPSKEGEVAYGQEVEKRALNFSALAPCTPGYFTRDRAIVGGRDRSARDQRLAAWGEGNPSYRHMVETYQRAGKLDGFSITS